MPKKKTNKEITENKAQVSSALSGWSFSLFIFIAAGILVFYPPFFRGLFFGRDLFINYIFTALLLILVGIDKIRNKDYTFLTTPLDWAVLAYAGAYLLSLAGAVHIGEAFYGFLKALNYFVVYWIVSQVVKNYRDYERIMQILIVSGVGVALVGILAAAGLCSYPEAFSGKYITSTMQYRNTSAAYVAVMILLATALWAKEKNYLRRSAYALADYFMMLMLIGTLSKGGWLVFMVGVGILLAGMPGKYRVRAFYALAVYGTASALTALKFMPVVTAGGKANSAVIYIVPGLAIVLLGEQLWKYLLGSSFHWDKKRAAAAMAVILAILVLSVIGVRMSSLSDKLQSSRIISQFQNIGNFSDYSYTSRADTYSWGIAMAEDHLLIGTGAGGWNALYHQYQNYLFYTTETHNHFLQVLIETGIVGLLAFLAMWIIMLWTIYKHGMLLRQKLKGAETDIAAEVWILQWGTAAGALTAGAHALIDYDLSLGAMCIMLWTLLALINSGSRMENIFPARKIPPVVFMAGGVTLAFVLLLSGACMLKASNLYNEANARFSQAQSLPAGTERLAQLQLIERLSIQAASLDPCNAKYPALMAVAGGLEYSSLNKNTDTQRAGLVKTSTYVAIETAQKLAPYDMEIRAALRNACILLNDPAGAAEQGRRLVAASPYDAQTYSRFITATVAAADDSLNRNDQSAAAGYLNEAVQSAARMEELKSKLDPVKAKLPFWTGAPFNLSADAQFNLGKSYYLLGDFARARAIFQPLQDAELTSGAKASPWYWAAVQKTGSQSEYQQGIQQLQNKDPESGAMLNKIQQLPILK